MTVGDAATRSASGSGPRGDHDATASSGFAASDADARPVHLIVLNEGSVIRLLFFVFRGVPFEVLIVAPWLPFMARPLEWIARSVSKGGRNELAGLKDLVADYEDVARRWIYGRTYEDSEDWLATECDFTGLNADGFEYFYPFKNVSVNRLRWHLNFAEVLAEVRRLFPRQHFSVLGAERESLEVHQLHHGAVEGMVAHPVWIPRRLVNALASMMVTVVAVCRILRWIAWRQPAPMPVRLGIDIIGSRRLCTLVGELVDEPNDVMCVGRNVFEYEREVERRWFAPFPVCSPVDGVMGPIAAIRAFVFILGQSARLWWRLGRLAPAHYMAAAKFPLIQITYRALFSKYRFANFLGRDDYNVEHIFRTWELRRIGGVSLGLNHSTPYFPIIYSIFRCIEFDIFYVFGEDICRKYYADEWPERMRIAPVGTFGMLHADLMIAASQPKPPDIAFFVKPRFEGLDPIEAVFAVARAFPDRTVYMKMKNRHRDGLDDGTEEAISRSLPANVRFTDETAETLSLKARYVISTPSTIVFEAIQYHCISFCYDVLPETTPLHFREYPDLCYRQIESIIDRINDIENGDWEFPRQSFNGLIELSGVNVFDAIRAEIGLPPKACMSTPDPISAMTAADPFVALLRCPSCHADGLVATDRSTLSCGACGAFYPVDPANNAVSLMRADAATPIKADIQDWWGDLYRQRYADLDAGLTAQSLDRHLEELEDLFRQRQHLAFTEMPVDDLAGKSVLEIGSGAGAHSALFQRRGARVAAVDITPERVVGTGRKLTLLGADAGRAFRADAENLPFRDGVFDIVYSNGVLHHSEDTDACIAEVHRVLKPGGRAVIMLYARHSSVFWLNIVPRAVVTGELFRWPEAQWIGRLTEGKPQFGTVRNPITRVYSERQLRSLFAGFHVQSLRKSSFQFDNLAVPRLTQIRNAVLKAVGRPPHPGGLLVYGAPFMVETSLELWLGRHIGWCWNVVVRK